MSLGPNVERALDTLKELSVAAHDAAARNRRNGDFGDTAADDPERPRDCGEPQSTQRQAARGGEGGMTNDLEFAIKQDIRNNPVVREVDLDQKREFVKMLGWAALASLLRPQEIRRRAVVELQMIDAPGDLILPLELVPAPAAASSAIVASAR